MPRTQPSGPSSGHAAKASGRRGLWLLLAGALLLTLGVILWALAPAPVEPVPEVAEWQPPVAPQLPAPALEPAVVVRAQPSATTAGLRGVIRSSSGAALVASLRLERDDGEGKETTSTGDGSFAFTQVPPGTWNLFVLAAGHKPGRWSAIVLRPGQALQRDLVLEVEGLALGRVVDERDQPVARAVITVVGDDSQVFRAGEDGTFAIPAPRDAARQFASLELIAVSPRHAPSPPTQARPGTPITLRVGDGGAVLARAVLAGGQTVAGAMVSLEPTQVEGPAPSAADAPPPGATRDDNQPTRFGPLRPGTYALRAEAVGFAPSTVSGVVVRAGATTGPIEVVLSAGATIRGTIVDASTGVGVRGASIRLLDPGAALPAPAATSYDGGAFALPNVPAGRVSLRVSAQGYRPELAPVVAPGSGEAEVTIRLQPAADGGKVGFQGIGATLGRAGAAVVVQALLPDSPAAQAGVAPGDRILRVDDRAVDGLGLMQVTELIRGEAGQPVVLEVERDGRSFRVQIVRGQVVLP